jgi:PhnB protein
MKVATYLNFNLNAQDVIDSYTTIFDAKVVLNMPYEEGMTETPALMGKVFHAELEIGDLNLYLADTGKEPDFSSVKLVAEISDADKAHQVFEQLAEGGKVLNPFEKMPFGPTIADVQDKFGIMWNIVIC